MTQRRPVPLLLIAATLPAWGAQAASDTIDRLAACATLTDDAQRLACFDREIAPYAKRDTSARTPAAPAPRAPEATPAPTPAPAPVVAQTPLPAADRAASFGEEQLSPSRRATEPETEEPTLTARITELRDNGGGTFVISLDNGQAWRHNDARRGSFLRKGEPVTIRRGALGSYRLTRDEGDEKNWIRVTRVR